MFTVRTPGTLVATISELKKHTRETVDAAKLAPVVIVRDGQPISTMISMELLEVLEEALEDRQLAKAAMDRLAAIEAGGEVPLEHGDFWAQVDARGAHSATAQAGPIARGTRRTRR